MNSLWNICLSKLENETPSTDFNTWIRPLQAVETEKELCKNMAEKYPKNYYAWMHRLWLLPQMNQYQVCRMK